MNQVQPDQIAYLLSLLRGQQGGQGLDQELLLNLLQQDPYGQRDQLAFSGFGKKQPQITPGTETATTGMRG